MTNKINGIDVSECSFYNNGKCNNPNGMACNCINNAVCYFKELKRLQKENEELKVRFNELYNNAEQLANKYNKYGGNKENELVEIINKTTDKKNKYKQALEEIRDFINPTYFDCKNCKELKKPFTQQNCNGFKYEAILNKIDEVLNDRS